MNNNQTQPTNQIKPSRFHLKTWQWLSVLIIVAVIVAGVFVVLGQRVERKFSVVKVKVDEYGAVIYDTSETEGLTIITSDYLMALEAADLFLTACIQRESEMAFNLLSERVKNRYPKEDLLIELSGMSNPHYQAFEIFNGRQVENNLYEFQIYFYDYYTGQQVKFNREEEPQLLRLVKAQDNRWYIDSFSRGAYSILFIKRDTGKPENEEETTPVSDKDIQNQPTTKPATKTDIELAREDLITYFNLLSEKQYDEAVKYHGSGYKFLQDWNPNININDHEMVTKLWF